MNVGLLGRKVGMTQIYEEDGTAVPVTVLECGPCTVLQIRTAERDGYHAIQLGFADKKRKSASQAERGHAKKVEAEPKKFIREIRQEAAADGVTEGQILTVEVFNEIKNVDVIGTSKGRGFSGVVRRWSMAGFVSTHGTHEYRRHGGSIGTNMTPGRTLPNLKMPGQYGAWRVQAMTVSSAPVSRMNASTAAS